MTGRSSFVRCFWRAWRLWALRPTEADEGAVVQALACTLAVCRVGTDCDLAGYCPACTGTALTREDALRAALRIVYRLKACTTWRAANSAAHRVADPGPAGCGRQRRTGRARRPPRAHLNRGERKLDHASRPASLPQTNARAEALRASLPGSAQAESPCRHHHLRRGSALLTVLWLTAALSAIGIALANNVRGETERAATSLDDTRAYFIARGAIERALLHMTWARSYSTPDGQPMYYRYGSPSMDLDFPSAAVHVEVIPEASKLPLNAAPPDQMLALLTALGEPESRALALASAIVDWRTPVTPDRPSPFDAFYLSGSPSFLPRHASFLENEELLEVKGVTPDLYYGTSLGAPDSASPGHSALRDCLSVFGSEAVDVNTARPETMIALGIAPADVTAIVERRRQAPFLDPREFRELQSALGPAGYHLRIGGNTMYTLRATARLKLAGGRLSDMRRSVGALVKFHLPGNLQGKPPGYDVLRWYDRF